MKTIIHVNQHNIKHNNKCDKEERKPVITCKTYKENNYYNNLVIQDTCGNELVRVIYSPDKPLSCGAKVWIECDSNNIIIEGE